MGGFQGDWGSPRGTGGLWGLLAIQGCWAVSRGRFGGLERLLDAWGGSVGCPRGSWRWGFGGPWLFGGLCQRALGGTGGPGVAGPGVPQGPHQLGDHRSPTVSGPPRPALPPRPPAGPEPDPEADPELALYYSSKEPILRGSPAVTAQGPRSGAGPGAGGRARRGAVAALLAAVLAYLVGGALVFRALEQPHELRQLREARATRDRFLQRHRCVPGPELDRLLQVRGETGRTGLMLAGD